MQPLSPSEGVKESGGDEGTSITGVKGRVKGGGIYQVRLGVYQKQVRESMIIIQEL